MYNNIKNSSYKSKNISKLEFSSFYFAGRKHTMNFGTIFIFFVLTELPMVLSTCESSSGTYVLFHVD